MDCNFIVKNEIHDKYLLHKLSDEEKQEYEQHIQDCERCRKELEHQRLIIGGIRQMGREEMKLEIRRQAEAYRKKRAGVNWTVILKTAAVILFLVLAPGMIYYYQYFAPLEKQKQTLQKSQPESPTEEIGKISTRGMGVPLGKELSTEPGIVKDKKSEKDAELPITKGTTREKTTQIKTGEEEAANEQELRDVLELKAKSNMERLDLSRKKIEAPLSQSGVAASDELLPQAGEGQAISGKGSMPDKIFRYNMISAPESQSQEDMSRSLFSQTNEAGTATAQKQLQYSFLNSNINVTLENSPIPLEKGDSTDLPVQFPVNILKKNRTEIDMAWQVSPSLFNINPNEILFQLPDSNTLQFYIQKKYTYQIDMKSRNTRAILQK